MAKSKWKIEGMKELEKSMKKLGKVPQKHITASAKKAMNIVLKDAKKKAPEGETGMLKKGIKLKGEKSRFKSKKVYRIIFDPAMNEIFQKKNKEGKITGYYPVSQEYGFFAKNGRYIPGYKFIHNAFENNAIGVEKTIVTEMRKRIDKELLKAGLK